MSHSRSQSPAAREETAAALISRRDGPLPVILQGEDQSLHTAKRTETMEWSETDQGGEEGRERNATQEPAGGEIYLHVGN